MSAIPAHCPYRIGDRVQLHGFIGYPPGPRRTGFVGEVEGYMGSSILSVLCDDGHVWCERWGALTREGERDPVTRTWPFACTCCPDPWVVELPEGDWPELQLD